MFLRKFQQIKKLARFSGIVYKARLYFSKTILLQFCASYIKSVISYGTLVYDNTYKMEEKHKFQKNIMTAIYFKKSSTENSKLFWQQEEIL